MYSHHSRSRTNRSYYAYSVPPTLYFTPPYLSQFIRQLSLYIRPHRIPDLIRTRQLHPSFPLCRQIARPNFQYCLGTAAIGFFVAPELTGAAGKLVSPSPSLPLCLIGDGLLLQSHSRLKRLETSSARVVLLAAGDLDAVGGRLDAAVGDALVCAGGAVVEDHVEAFGAGVEVLG